MLYLILRTQEVLNRDMLNQTEGMIKRLMVKRLSVCGLLVPYLLRLQIQARLSFVVCWNCVAGCKEGSAS